jgi:hypothetical protein
VEREREAGERENNGRGLFEIELSSADAADPIALLHYQARELEQHPKRGAFG